MVHNKKIFKKEKRNASVEISCMFPTRLLKRDTYALKKILNVHDKNTQHTRNIRGLPQPDKEHTKKPTANIILNGERLNAFPQYRKQNKVVCSCSFIQCYTEGSSQGN